MCGIAGMARQAGLGSEARTLLKKMCDVISHRGPDDEGFFISDKAAIGMRRLSIIDLQTGHQPVFNEDKSLAVVLNGEIYNYRQLRKQLLSNGHHLSTNSDTETIAHLYEDFGDDCVRHLRGMFSFALWDDRRKRLLIARDRVGIKPLYYSEINGEFFFGSEIKCILQSSRFSPRLRAASVLEYFTTLYTPSPNTIYEGISELPPAHYMTWQDGQVQTRRYWQLEYRPDTVRTEEQHIEGMLSKVTSAVQSHMVADVPVGGFLSGGIDSGITVALMAQAIDTPVQTFTIGFEGDYGFYDERKDADIVAKSYRTNHHELVVRPDVKEILLEIVGSFDQPHADSSSIPNYYVCKLARTQVKVALSGVGGDEIAGGYERYLGVMIGERYRKLPRFVRNTVAKTILAFPDSGGGGRFSSARLKRFVVSAEQDAPSAYLQLISTFDSKELNLLLVGDLRSEVLHYSPLDRIQQNFDHAKDDCINGMLYEDLNGYLPGDLLQLSDRLSMLHSLELRVPLLDHELLEYVATIPSELKINGITKKYILRKIGEKLLPQEIMSKPKRGFSVPLAFWLRNELRPIVEEQLSTKSLSELGFFNPKYVQQLIHDHFTSRANHENKIWALLMFTLWHDRYMGKEAMQGAVGI